MTKRDPNPALSDFLASVEKKAYRMAQLAINDREEAFDIVQDAMISLVKRYGQKEPQQWRPLFYRILHNRIQDHYRRAKTRRMVFGWFSGQQDDDETGTVDPVNNAADATPGGSEQLKSSRAVAALDEAISQLPLRQQQAVMLRLWEGLSVAETAHAMRCSHGSVKTHYSRAISKLRETLGEHWP